MNCPSNANAYYNLGVSYAEMHKYDKALLRENQGQVNHGLWMSNMKMLGEQCEYG